VKNITDDASGVLMEGMLESMAEYYSKKLSQKVQRGMDLNASKCLSNGGKIALGFKIDKDRHFTMDEKLPRLLTKFLKCTQTGKQLPRLQAI
jgi:DNA invertase Pin-like site-specific DNA recombinase